MNTPELQEVTVTELPNGDAGSVYATPSLELNGGVSGSDNGQTIQGDPEDLEFGDYEEVADSEVAPPANDNEGDITVDGLANAVKGQREADADTEDVDDEIETIDADDKQPSTGRITDEASFTSFYAANTGYVVNLLMSGGLSQADAEDVSQTTFANAWKSRERFDGQNPRGWLTRIARNEAISLHRREQRGPQQVTDEEQQDEAFRKAAGTERDPADIVVSKEDATRVVQIMKESGISDRWMSILWHKHGLGFEDHETAELLGIARGTVASGSNRAIQRVRESLKDKE